MFFSFFFRYYYSGYSLSNDELSAVNRLDFSNLHDLIMFGIRPDGHPAFAQLLLWFHTRIFGLSPASIRFPFIFISSLAPLFAYFFMKNINGKAPALFLSTAVAFLQFPVLYGQIARPYGIGLTFSLMSAWLWTEMLLKFPPKKKKRIILTAALALSWTLCLYTHYFAGLTAAVMGISGLFLLTKENKKNYLYAALITSILFLPHLSITLHQISLGGVGQWLGKPEPVFLVNHLLFIFNGSFIILALFLILPKDLSKVQNRKLRKIRIILALWFLIPLLTGYFYSVYINPVLQNSVLIFSMPFLIALIFSFNYRHLSQWNKIALIFFSVILTVNLIFPVNFLKQQHFGDFRGTAKALSDFQKKYGKEKIVNIAEINHRYYLDYYFDRTGTKVNFIGGKSNDTQGFMRLKKIIDSIETPFVSYSDLQNTSSHIARSIILSKYPLIRNITKFGDKTTVFLLQKDSAGFEIPDSVTYVTDKYCCGGFEKIPQESKNEFTLNINYSIILTDTSNTGLSIVFDIVDKDGKSVLWRNIPLKFLHRENNIIRAKIYEHFTLKKNFSGVKYYILNPSGERFYGKPAQLPD
jgi:hypothetical protein